MSTTKDTAAEPVQADFSTRAMVAGLVQRYGAALVLVIMIMVGTLTFPTFLSFGNFANIFTQSSFLLIMAVGMTFVILTGGIDLSVGSMFALGGVCAAYGATAFGVVGGFALPLVVCGAIGALQGALIAFGGMAPFIVTLAGLLGVRGLVFAITDGGRVTPLIDDVTFSAIGQGGIFGIHWTVLIAVGVAVIGGVVLSRSGAGQAVLAVGGSEHAATLMGLPVARLRFAVYCFSGLCSGLAGALSAGYLSSGVPTVGYGMELTIISAVVIGGTLLTGGKGTITGTVAGVLLLGVIQNLINQVGTLGSSVQSVVSGGFLAAVVIMQTVLSRTQRP